MRGIAVYKCPDCGRFHEMDISEVPQEVRDVMNQILDEYGDIPRIFMRVPDLSEFLPDDPVEAFDRQYGIHGPVL